MDSSSDHQNSVTTYSPRHKRDSTSRVRTRFTAGFQRTVLGTLTLALAMSTSLWSGAAHARFGKGGSGGGQHGGGGGGGGSHAASAPGYSGGRTYYSPGYYGSYYVGPRYFYGPPYWYSPYWFGWGFGYYPYFYAEPPPPSITYVRPADREPEEPPKVTVGVEGQTVGGSFKLTKDEIRSGNALGATFAVEGHRVGFLGQFTGITVGTDDGTPGKDRIGLLDAHLTYALLAGQQGRLRVEAGADTAFAPSVTLIGLGLGVSGVVTVVGPVGIDGAFRITTWPFTQVDASGGLIVRLGPIGLRGGWRRIWLNDNGAAEPDGTAHTDLFSGPYAGVTATF